MSNNSQLRELVDTGEKNILPALLPGIEPDPELDASTHLAICPTPTH